MTEEVVGEDVHGPVMEMRHGTEAGPSPVEYQRGVISAQIPFLLWYGMMYVSLLYWHLHILWDM